MTLGTRGKPGMTDHNFYLPTDIAFAPNGELVVTDGYGNARMVRFSQDGKFLGQFGKRGNGPGQFQLPHNVVIDARRAGSMSPTATTSGSRCSTPAANISASGTMSAALSSLIMTPDQHIWAGGVLRDLDGKALEHLPGEAPMRAPMAARSRPMAMSISACSAATAEKFVRQ